MRFGGGAATIPPAAQTTYKQILKIRELIYSSTLKINGYTKNFINFQPASIKCFCCLVNHAGYFFAAVHHPCDSGRHHCNLSYSTCKKEPGVGERNYTCPCKVGFTGIPGNCKGNIKRPVHTNAFSIVCVFVVIENASIDSRPHYRFDAFLTAQTKTFENDIITRCHVHVS